MATMAIVAVMMWCDGKIVAMSVVMIVMMTTTKTMMTGRAGDPPITCGFFESFSVCITTHRAMPSHGEHVNAYGHTGVRGRRYGRLSSSLGRAGFSGPAGDDRGPPGW